MHGAGSFGHVVASEHQLQHGFKEKSQIAGLAQVLADVRELDLKVLRALDAENVPAASLPPSAIATMRNGKLSSLDMREVQRIP